MFLSRLTQRYRSRNRGSRQRSVEFDIRPIRIQADRLSCQSDSQLTRQAIELRERMSLSEPDSATAANLQVAAFALAAEAVRRTTDKVYYDVQLQAGQTLARGDLAEMQTGEGKTLVTLLPVFRAVAGGHHVHVATTNSYLAQRDCAELRPAFELLGASVGLLPEENDDAQKRAAYECDVTYGTGYEFGFDYLRDQLTLRQQPPDRLGDAWLRSLADINRPRPALVQSQRHLTIIDEIDSVLIDEANTPLVISFFGSDQPDIEPYRRAASAADQLDDTRDYHVNSAEQRITITPSGLDRINTQLRTFAPQHLQRPWRIYIEQALRARYLLHRDVDYVLQDGKVALVDQHTGRIFPDRKWRDGLHQAIEFREGAELTPETNSFARISRQRFFKLYQHGTGMTGTATDAADEFRDFFELNVVPIPLNRPSQRQVLSTRYFADADARYQAIVADAVARHRHLQPVLIGTRTIDQSRAISEQLTAKKIPHNVLNGIQDADEASIIAVAGAAGAVTVATNMAGRGTDIKLSARSCDVGGLHVIAAEPNRSHRVDRQLIGRCARQGEPGSCQLYVSADDQLLQAEGTSLAKRIRRTASHNGEASITDDSEIRAIQSRAERIDFARRQHLMQQELWIDSVLQTLVGEEGTAA